MKTHRTASLALLLALAAACAAGPAAHAQANDSIFARTYTITGTQPASGDIISLNPDTGKLHLSGVAGDRTIFGVAVANPILLLRSSGGTVPIVTSGQVDVNVTTNAGPIRVGDFVTSSSRPGEGELATSTQGYVLGTALAPFPADAGSYATGTLATGTIPVLLSVGPYPASAVPQPPQQQARKNFLNVNAGTVLRYVLAATVAIGSIALAFRNFGSSIRDGIVSVGRNPLAKSSIQSMVLLNALLIAFVSASGLLVGLAILFLPF